MQHAGNDAVPISVSRGVAQVCTVLSALQFSLSYTQGRSQEFDLGRGVKILTEAHSGAISNMSWVTVEEQPHRNFLGRLMLGEGYIYRYTSRRYAAAYDMI